MRGYRWVWMNLSQLNAQSPKKVMDGPQIQDNPTKRGAHELLPEIPQFDSWARLEASVTKLQEAVNQLKE